MKHLRTLLLATLALLLICAAIPAMADYGDGMTKMVDEPETYGVTLEANCFFDEELKTAQDVAWVDGILGKGIDMNQAYREHFRFTVAPIWEATGLTINAWVNWRGAGVGPDGAVNEADQYGQLIFGMSGASGHYKMVACDSAENPVVNFEGGLYGADVSAKAAAGLPVGEWAMVTFTLDGEFMRVYINGELSGEAAQTVVPDDLALDLFRVGSSFWGPPTFNAVVDEAAVWSRGLTGEEVAALYASYAK